MIKKPTLAIAIVLLMFPLFYSGTANANPVSDWQDRKYVRENWKVGQDEVTSKELDRVLNSKYSDTNLTWRQIARAVQATDALVKEARQSRIEATLDEAIDYIKKKPIEFAVSKSLDTVKLGFVGETYSWYQLLQEVNAGANKTALSNQIKLYSYAREAGISHKAIVEQNADGVEFDYEGKGWVLGLEQHNAPLSYAAIPTNMTSQQAWQIAKFLWDMKSNAANFDKEKKSIGEKFYAVATDPTDVLKTYFMYVVSARLPNFKDGSISAKDIIAFAMRKEWLKDHLHEGEDKNLSYKSNFEYLGAAKGYQSRIHRKHIDSISENFFGKKVAHESVHNWRYTDGYYVGDLSHYMEMSFSDIEKFTVRQMSKNNFNVFVESKDSIWGGGVEISKETATVVRKISSGPFPKVSYSIIEHKNLGTRSVER